jgi:hypothetical protein
MAELTREIIDSEHYVARYARGSLSEQEAERFEEFCLLHPELVPDVRVDREMRRALRAIDARVSGKGRRLDWRTLAIAASVILVAVVIGWKFWRSDEAPGALYAVSANLPATLREDVAGPFVVLRQRGGGVQTLHVPAGATALRLDLELPADHGPGQRHLALEESVGDDWLLRGQMELAAHSAHWVVPLVIDLRAARGSRMRLVLSGPDGGNDAFDLRLVPAR